MSELQDARSTFTSLTKASSGTPGSAESTPNSSYILYQLGQALTCAGREQEAKKVLAELRLRRALDVWSKTRQHDVNAAVQGRVVDAFVAAGKLDEAILFLTDILHRQSNVPWHWPASRRLLRQTRPNRAALPNSAA